MRKVHTGRGPRLTVMALAAVLAAGGWPSAQAVSFQSSSGDWTGSWDTTIGYGEAWRVSGLDCRLVAIADGGCGYSPNIDDGELNYRKKAAFSEALTGVSEIALNYKEQGGVFLRGSGLYDFEVMNATTDHIQLTHDAKGVAGSYTRLLDAFGFWRFNLGTMPAEMRLGRQVVDWGESTYIPGGLNEVNHFDVTALQVPGAELKQALLPDEMALFNLQLSKNLSTQLLYLFDWREDIIEPDGAYFSTSDFAGPGGNRVFLGFGAISDQGVDFRPLGGALISDFQAVNRLPDHRPLQSGQFGVDFKLYLPNFSQGTQVGVYFLNYTSRLPVVSGMTGSQAGFGNAFGAVNAVGAAAHVSFNTQIQKTGTALQGEVTFRHNVPLQLDDVELIYASLTPFESGIARLLGEPVSSPGVCIQGVTPITGCNQLGSFGLGQVIRGWELKNTWQAQLTATQVFANVLKASQAVLLFEAAADYIPGLEDEFNGGPVGRGLRYDGPGTNLSGNPSLGGYPEFPTLVEPGYAFPDKFSWGYVVAGRLEYDNALGALNLLPHFTWSHDVKGVSPGPGGNFIEGRHALSVGLGASLRSKWDFDVSYTQYGGAGQYNLGNDRDFVAASIRYSF
ncbi:MAG: DUF1302 domain-containing protein [Gammaproteobacteria bacterium]|nr:MAG: DUF1302 domain-containing protein [Gammaproteobacteria bacterium]